MRVRPLSAALLAAGVALATPASAVGPQIVDKADDANYLNDNSPVLTPVENPLNHNPTPVGSTAAADILSVEWRSLYGGRNVLLGFTVTMVLKAAPAKQGVLYRAMAETDSCTQLWLQYYSSRPQHTPQTSLRHTCDGSVVVVAAPARVQGSTIVWTVDLRAKSTPPQVTKGTELRGLSAHTRDFVDNPDCVLDDSRCVTSPTQYDTTRTASATYTVGD